MFRIHVLPPRLPQLQIEPSKRRPQRDIQLRVCQIFPQAAPRSFAERQHVLLQFLTVRLQPALRAKITVVGEQFFVLVDEHGTHAYGCVGRDGPVAVFHACF